MPLKKEYKYLLFVLVWILVEWLSCEWELSFSFHILGYCLGNVPLVTQWYQYTGVIGGSIWILWLNFIFLYIIDSVKERNKHKIWIYSIISLIPLCVSFFLYLTPFTTQRMEKVCVLNLSDNDTFNERTQLIDAINYLSVASFDSTDSFIIMPETICYLPASAIPYNVYFSTIKLLLKRRAPQASVMFGASTQDLSKGASFNDVDFFNMVLCCDTSGLTNYRNKMLLVPFGEFIPYKGFFGKIPDIEKIVHNSTLHERKYDTIFCKRNMCILPLICYELYFSNHIANYIRKNKIEIIITVSNDHSVKDSLFAQQFVRMAQVQAVTFAKPIIKSATHGFSFIISPEGKVLSKSHFNSVELIEASTPLNNKITLFARMGNTAAFLYWIILLLTMIITEYYETTTNKTNM
jgi:apolipoprotein N-acyltransferase